MSMPKRLLGKSRTCPLLATTSKSGPRYLLMVLALAGDSTITRFFFFLVATSNFLEECFAVSYPLWAVCVRSSRVRGSRGPKRVRNHGLPHTTNNSLFTPHNYPH